MTTLVFLLFQSRSKNAIAVCEYKKDSVIDAPGFTSFSEMKIYFVEVRGP